MNIAIIISNNNKKIQRIDEKEFCGKPIVLYSIEATINSGLFDEVLLLTEDEKIASVVQGQGVTVLSKSYEGDDVEIVDKLIDIVNEYRKKEVCIERICCLYSTVPFVTAKKLITANTLMDNNKADAVIPVVKFSFPPQRGRILDGDCLKYKWPENILKRSQDLEPLYHDANQFYLINVEALINEHKTIPSLSVPYIQKETEVHNIESTDDWKVAEIKYLQMIKRNEY